MCYFGYKQNQLSVPELNSNSNDTNLPVIVAKAQLESVARYIKIFVNKK
jgi:hypothetical protein